MADGKALFISSLPSVVCDLLAGVTAKFTRTASFHASVGYQICADGQLHGNDGKRGVRCNG